jgi:hypothetical protein
MILTLMALSAALQPERWVHVDGSRGLHEDYVDRDSIARTGDKVSLWTRRDLVREKATLWHEIELDCTAGTETILAWVRDESGTVSHSVERPFRAASPIRPDSVQRKVADLACRRSAPVSGLRPPAARRGRAPPSRA